MACCGTLLRRRTLQVTTKGPAALFTTLWQANKVVASIQGTLVAVVTGQLTAPGPRGPGQRPWIALQPGYNNGRRCCSSHWRSVIYGRLYGPWLWPGQRSPRHPVWQLKLNPLRRHHRPPPRREWSFCPANWLPESAPHSRFWTFKDGWPQMQL